MATLQDGYNYRVLATKTLGLPLFRQQGDKEPVDTVHVSKTRAVIGTLVGRKGRTELLFWIPEFEGFVAVPTPQTNSNVQIFTATGVVEKAT